MCLIGKVHLHMSIKVFEQIRPNVHEVVRGRCVAADCSLNKRQTMSMSWCQMMGRAKTSL